MKLFAYHKGDGVSFWRVIQPMKYLARHGITVKIPPNRMDRVHWDGLTGPCNIPGIGSHAEIADTSDVIFSSFVATEEEGARLWAQSQMKPLVIDIDDDITSMDPLNPGSKFWNSNKGEKDQWFEIPEGEEAHPKWKVEAEAMGAVLMLHPETGKLCAYKAQRNPQEIVFDQLRNASLVTVATERLKRIYSKYNENIVVSPNAIDFEAWPEPVKINDGYVRMGLFGSNSHFRDWREIAQVIQQALAENPKLKLVFNTWYVAQGKKGDSLDEMQTRPQIPDFMKWAINHPQVEMFSGCEVWDYPRWLADKGVDFLLAPLADTVFNKAKSNLKYIEAGGMRTPLIAQDMEPYNTDIKNGLNGFLCHKPHDWLVCIRRLATDHLLRASMGGAAYIDVKTRFDQDRVSARLAEQIKKLGVKNALVTA